MKDYVLKVFDRVKLLIAKTTRWLKGFIVWLKDARFFLYSMSGVIVVSCFGFWIFELERAFRLIGLVFQLVGMWLAISGLFGVREYFGLPTLWQVFIDWLKRFPRWTNGVTFEVSGTTSSSFSGEAYLDVWSYDDPSKSVEERLVEISRNLVRLRDEHKLSCRSIANINTDLQNHKKITADSTKKLEENMHKAMESLHTTDWLKSFVGLVILTIGIVLSTAAPDFVKILTMFQ